MYIPYNLQEPFRYVSTTSCSDPGGMHQYGLHCINLRAKYRKLKGWQKTKK